MDARFHGLMQAAWRGRLAEFEEILDRSPSLVTDRSSCSHPTVLQFVVLDGAAEKVPEAQRFVSALVSRGARLDEPLVAAASVGSLDMTERLLVAGAPVEACTPWTPLEESVYWAHRDLSARLREIGALVRSLRVAAGLNDVSATASYLDGQSVRKGAGPVRFPWGTDSEHDSDVLNQALVIAAKNDATDSLTLLIEAGADVNSFPPGVHEGGSALHLAAMLGRDAAVEILLDAGADRTVPDPKHGSDPSGWARHGGFELLATRLAR